MADNVSIADIDALFAELKEELLVLPTAQATKFLDDKLVEVRSMTANIKLENERKRVSEILAACNPLIEEGKWSELWGAYPDCQPNNWEMILSALGEVAFKAAIRSLMPALPAPPKPKSWAAAAASNVAVPQLPAAKPAPKGIVLARVEDTSKDDDIFHARCYVRSDQYESLPVEDSPTLPELENLLHDEDLSADWETVLTLMRQLLLDLGADQINIVKRDSSYHLVFIGARTPEINLSEPVKVSQKPVDSIILSDKFRLAGVRALAVHEWKLKYIHTVLFAAIQKLLGALTQE